MNVVKLLREALARAHATRPDIKDSDLIAPIGEGEAQSVDEFNASGETMVFVCFRVADAKTVVQGSSKVLCDSCLAPVWISPATLALSERLKKKMVCCVQCSVLKPK